MQAKSEHFSEFSERTERLSVHIGVSLRDLAEKIGISQAMLFAYRRGKNPISSKAWAKLEAAERKAGVAVRSESLPLSTDIPIEQQPSDAHLKAIKAELDQTHPVRCRLAMQKELGVLADYLADGNFAKARKEQDRLNRLLDDTIREAFMNAATSAILHPKTGDFQHAP